MECTPPPPVSIYIISSRTQPLGQLVNSTYMISHSAAQVMPIGDAKGRRAGGSAVPCIPFNCSDDALRPSSIVHLFKLDSSIQYLGNLRIEIPPPPPPKSQTTNAQATKLHRYMPHKRHDILTVVIVLFQTSRRQANGMQRTTKEKTLQTGLQTKKQYMRKGVNYMQVLKSV
jgi:hypothetical protein